MQARVRSVTSGPLEVLENEVPFRNFVEALYREIIISFQDFIEQLSQGPLGQLLVGQAVKIKLIRSRIACIPPMNLTFHRIEIVSHFDNIIDAP